jgi:hypothetical protein
MDASTAPAMDDCGSIGALRQPSDSHYEAAGDTAVFDNFRKYFIQTRWIAYRPTTRFAAHISTWNNRARRDSQNFDFTTSSTPVDIEALAARYQNQDFWHRSMTEAEGDGPPM